MPSTAAAVPAPAPTIEIVADRDGWVVTGPGARSGAQRTSTLHVARRLAREQAGPRDRVVVRDHYHRIVPTDAPVPARAGR